MSDWRTVKLGDLGTFRNGLNFAANARGEGLAIVGVRDFQDRSFVRFDGLEQLDPRALGTGEALIRRNDILFVRSNGNRELIGRSLLVKEHPPIPTSHSGFTIRFRLQDDGTDPLFLAYLLRSGAVRRQLSQQGGGTSINNLNQGILAALDLAYPPLDVQRRISSILGAYDDLIEVNRRRIALSEEMARRLFEEWFVYFRFPGSQQADGSVRSPEVIPPGWCEVPLSELCSGITDGAHFSPSSVPTGQLMASVKDMHDWGFNLTGCRQIGEDDFAELIRLGCQPKAGDILIAKDGANLNKHTFVLSEHMPIVLLSSIAIIRPKPSIEREFLVALLKSERTSSAIKAMKSGAAIPRIVLKDFKRLPILLPSEDIRQRFDRAVAPLHGLCRVLSLTNEKLTAHRDFLLPRLISGELPLAAAARELEAAA